MSASSICVGCGKAIKEPEKNYPIRGNYCLRCSPDDDFDMIPKVAVVKPKRDLEVSVGGFTKSLASWARFLGISRQRAHQLKNECHLERRIRNVINLTKK